MESSRRGEVRRRARRVRCAGSGWIEALAGLALVSIGVLVVLPALAWVRRADRAGVAARHMATSFQATRWKAVAGGVSRGLFFERDANGWVWTEVEDGNGNGIRTAEIRRGVDPVRSGPHRLEHRVEGVALGFPPGGPFPEIPPERGWIPNTDDPVKFGRSDVVSFHPLGRSSSGTVYLTDGDDGLFGVVLFGPTVRVRVWRYLAEEKRWTL